MNASMRRNARSRRLRLFLSSVWLFGAWSAAAAAPEDGSSSAVTDQSVAGSPPAAESATTTSSSGRYHLQGTCRPMHLPPSSTGPDSSQTRFPWGRSGSHAPLPYRVKAVAEAGFVGVLTHQIQFGENGTYFSYTRDGGQDVLFPVTRWSVEASPWPMDTFIFLYQPLELNTAQALRDPLVVDAVTFPAGTPMDFRYSFPFYRLSYLHDFSNQPGTEWSGGLSLQIRNATIEFRDQAGTQFTRNTDIGLVPLLKFRWKTQWDNGWWLGTEIDGIYAPVSYLNGSDTEITGALLDASVRLGLRLRRQDVFLNIRYLGGGAVGSNPKDDQISDGYVKNWLQFLIVSLGFSTSLF